MRKMQYLCGGFCDFIAFICPKNVILKGFFASICVI